MSSFIRHEKGYFIADTATVIGDVAIGADSSFWFASVTRADVAPISIGQRVNVQDGAVIHVDTDVANVIEDDVTIGHRAVVHGKFVGRGSLIGMGAILLSRTVVGKECLIGAGAVVPPDMKVPDGSVVMGVPGKIVRQISKEDTTYMRWLAAHYVKLAEKHVRGEFK